MTYTFRMEFNQRGGQKGRQQCQRWLNARGGGCKCHVSKYAAAILDFMSALLFASHSRLDVLYLPAIM